MAQFVYQPWVGTTGDRLLDLQRRSAILICEAERRIIQTPGGLDDLQGAVTDLGHPFMPESHLALLTRINEGKEPSRIKEIRPEGDERKQLKAMGHGKTPEERKSIIRHFEIQVLLKEAERIGHAYQTELARRDPGYPPMRRRRLEALLEKMQESTENASEDKDGGEWLTFLEMMVMNPPEPQGIAAADKNDDTDFIWDPQRNVLHLQRNTVASDGLTYLSAPCARFLDLEQNGNLRSVLVVYLAASNDEATKPCDDCLPQGLENRRIEITGDAGNVLDDIVLHDSLTNA